MIEDHECRRLAILELLSNKHTESKNIFHLTRPTKERKGERLAFLPRRVWHARPDRDSSSACHIPSLAKAALFLFLAYSGLVYAAGREKKNEKKHTEHERVQFLGTTEHERGPYTHAPRQKTHTEHERVQF